MLQYIAMMTHARRCFSLIVFVLVALLTACAPTEEPPEIIVSLVADGRELTFSYPVPVTVAEFLEDADIELGDLDQVNPQTYTQIADGMQVTVVRITQENECEEQSLAFTTRRVLNEGLGPGEERLGQAGQNGTIQICYRVESRDGIPRDPVETSRTVVTQPTDEIIYVGPTGEVEPVTVNGTLAYISNRNAWVIRGSSTTKRPLTTTGDIDSRVFSLSEDGRQLLFTRQLTGADSSVFNRLWLIHDTAVDAPPTELLPDNILYAEWVPGQPNTISYSTGEARTTPPGWQAYNDLWLMRLDPQTGEPVNVEEVVDRSCSGLYCWWGTGYQWSHDGEQVAWIGADSIGLVDLDSGDLTTLLSFPVYETYQSWSWRANVSWSPDNALLLTTVHGLPIGSEPPATSPAFHVAVTDTAGTYYAEIIRNAGIWSTPRYSPMVSGGEFPNGYLAYLRCRDFPNCVSDSAAYELMVADRDGSNSRVVFPPAGQPGITQREFVWSPDGRQIAFIYQGNLWIVDVETRLANQLTLDGGASRPVWTQ